MNQNMDLISDPEIINILFPSDYSDAREKIRVERARIDNFLATNPKEKVYGFSTLLGHLDYQGSSPSAQTDLLRSHLIGPTKNFADPWAQLLARVKLAQVTNGGTGIHPHCFDVLEKLAVSEDQGQSLDRRWEGNWTASYGSGDVVPAAWFVSGLNKHFRLTLDNDGDLISLINGNFVSTTVALIALARFNALSHEALRIISDTSPANGSTQEAVTRRDISPLAQSIDFARENLNSTLKYRLTHASGNPLFLLSKDHVKPESQSSFLEFTLTGAIAVTLQTVSQLGVYLKSSLKAQIASLPQNSQTPIQPIKIIEAYLRKISSTLVVNHFGLEESEGVEDVGDLSMISATKLLEVLDFLDAIIEIHHQTLKTEREQIVVSPDQSLLNKLTRKSFPDLLA